MHKWTIERIFCLIFSINTEIFARFSVKILVCYADFYFENILWPYVDLFRGRLIVAHRSDLRSAIGQLARRGGYEPTSEKIKIRPLECTQVSSEEKKKKKVPA